MATNLNQLEQKEFELSHLGLDFSQINFDTLKDPFSHYYSTDNYLEILRAIRDPANFAFTCKYIFNVEPTVFQLVWLEQLWNYPFPMIIAGRGASKSFTTALYHALRATINQGSKIVIASASFRQAKVVFEYIESIWYNAPVWRDLCGDSSKPVRLPEMYTFKIGKSRIVAIPLGSGEKIRGLRGNYVHVEEFNCQDANTLVETTYGIFRLKEIVEDHLDRLINKDGEYENPVRYIKTPEPVDVYEVITERGYSFRCSKKHKVLTTKGFKIAKDLTSEDCIISENKYIFPQTSIVDENTAWAFGLLTAEGYINSKHRFGVLMTDLDCVSRFGESISKINPDQYISIKSKDGYYDTRFKSQCKKYYWLSINNTKLRDKFEALGLERCKAIDKKIPWSILQSSRNVVVRYLSGLFEGDGSAFLWKQAKQNNRLGVAYYTISKQLAQEVQILLKKLGYLSNLQSRKSNISDNPGYIVRLNGLYAYQFAMELNIHKWNNVLNSCYERNLEDKPSIWYNKINNNYKVYCRVNGKTKTIGTRKTYEEALQLYNENNIEHLKVKSVELLPEKDILYDIEVPETHTFYGNGMVQHNSISKEIYEVVLRGFTATSSNPVENIKSKAKLNKLRKKGLLTPELEKEIAGIYKPNQIILTGTAGWDFQIFSEYHKKYRKIIKSGGNEEKIKDILGKRPDKGFDYKDYCIIRVPADLLPEGLLDEKAIANAKATMDEASYQREFGAIFVKDSNGFFPITLIQGCTCKEPIQVGSREVKFGARVRGDMATKYILGCDPASEADNLAIVILEHHSDHNRVVYCWTMRRVDLMKRVKDKSTSENNFYAFIGKKIRSLMNAFPIDYIALDTQGGGIACAEMLHDVKRLEPGEVCVWPLRKEDPIRFQGFKDYGYDDEQGIHMIEMVNMSSAEYVLEANHGMKKDLQNKMLIFPYTDAVTLAMAEMHESAAEKYDTLEDVILEIEELKNELSTIQHTTTLNGRDRFDTPNSLTNEGKKMKLRKDRYSALMMANAIARRLFRQSTIDYSSKAVGGFANQFQGQDVNGPMYIGPDEFVKWANQSVLGIGVNQQQSSDPFSYYGQAFPQYSR